MTDFRPRSLALVGAFLLVVPSAVGAQAQAPIETALKDLVAAIDAAPDWKASYQALAYDAASDTGVVSGLTIATNDDSLRFGLETVSVSGYAPAPDGGFTAKSMSAGGGALDAEGVFKVALSEIKIDDVAIPGFEGVAYSREQPFTSIIRIYTRVLKTRFARAEPRQPGADRADRGGHQPRLLRELRHHRRRRRQDRLGHCRSAPHGITLSRRPGHHVGGQRREPRYRPRRLRACLRPRPVCQRRRRHDLADTIGFAGYRDLVVELAGAKVSVGILGR